MLLVAGQASALDLSKQLAVTDDGGCPERSVDPLPPDLLASLHVEQGKVESGQKTLRLNCLLVMGGVEVKARPRER